MLDTQGPEIRTGCVNAGGGKVTYTKDQIFEITTDYDKENTSEVLACNYERLPESVKRGTQILIGDGALTAEVVEIKEKSVMVKALNTTSLGQRKNMNLPGCKVLLPTLTEKDKSDIVDFGLDAGIDMIAASFIRSAEDVKNI